MASSNYVINEILDAPSDAHHPAKRTRPVPSGVSPSARGTCSGSGDVRGRSLAGELCVDWLRAHHGGVLGDGLYLQLSPIRSKDRPYIDVLSESINNPIRMLAGWLMVGPDAVTPASLMLSYWMIGCYFMAIKRFAEYRYIDDAEFATRYRRSFEYYSEERLLTSIMFYASAAMLFFGVFVMRYRLELILSFPLVALAMAEYLRLGLEPDSPTQRPEALYREPRLMLACGTCFVIMLVCLFVDMPWLDALLTPMAPTR